MKTKKYQATLNMLNVRRERPGYKLRRNAVIDLTCEVCGDLFPTDNTRTLWCSELCSGKAKRAAAKDRATLYKEQQAKTPPEGFDTITTYKELTDYTLAFANGDIEFLLLVGSPGSGKSRQMRTDLDKDEADYLWIDSHATNLGLYCSVYESHGKHVICDDINHLLDNRQSRSLIKALTQTEAKRNVSWESSAKYLDEREVPRQYTTSSPICLIANVWRSKDADYAAIQDRSLPVAFYPDAETIHQRVLELGWCHEDVIKFIGDNLFRIPQPSMREYFNAMRYKRFLKDWQGKVMSLWDGGEKASASDWRG